ncbi:MAG: activase, partial [Desulfobacterales bacterium]|nr:activase [Desulfobacterales bacterium]
LLMGVSRPEAEKSFARALENQRACQQVMKQIGREVIAQLETDPEQMAMVLCGRSYNAFAGEANMGIPHKIASRNMMVIPLDFLPIEGERAKPDMYWGMGQMILKAGRLVSGHPQLFSIFITNFSCGPDSFIIGYFRDIMGKKPSLTLELDNHTADAGLETRIEAFFDVVAAYRQLTRRKQIVSGGNGFKPARTLFQGRIPQVTTSSGEQLPMNHPRVTLLLPSMGGISSESLAAVFRSGGYNARAHKPADEAVLKLGRGNTSCKECLPLILTTGTLLNYVHNARREDEVVVFFMPTGTGPCRFGQYYVFMKDLVKRLKLENVALFSLNEQSAYTDIGNDFHKKGWWAVIIADVLEDIRAMLLANAHYPEGALSIFNAEVTKILATLEKGSYPNIEEQLLETARKLGHIELKRPCGEVPLVLLTGEIFVRRDALSRQNITEKLAQKGFATICSPIAEWMHYVDYLDDHINPPQELSLMGKIGQKLRRNAMQKYEARIKTVLATSGLVHSAPVQVESVISKAAPFISPQLMGEAILTIGSSLSEVVTDVCGVIAIGPFGCMPNRISEAILNDIMNPADKLASEPHNKELHATLEKVEDLPFLSIESDGSPFPQLANAKLEAFCLRAQRLHHRIQTIS